MARQRVSTGSQIAHSTGASQAKHCSIFARSPAIQRGVHAGAGAAPKCRRVCVLHDEEGRPKRTREKLTKRVFVCVRSFGMCVRVLDSHLSNDSYRATELEEACAPDLLPAFAIATANSRANVPRLPLAGLVHCRLRVSLLLVLSQKKVTVTGQGGGTEGLDGLEYE